jgi:hypothetical protein
MDEKPDQIIEHIDAQREQLGRNLNELETRVRQSTNWRTYFDRNPMLVLSAALGGGVLLGSLVGPSRRSSHRLRSGAGQTGAMASSAASTSSVASPASSKTRRPSGPATSVQKAKVNETVDQFKAALIAFGIAKAKEFACDLIPGFEQQLGTVEQSRQEHRTNVSSSASSPYPSYGREEFRSHTDPSRRSTATETRSQQPAGTERP